jgi:hypothetical protein
MSQEIKLIDVKDLVLWTENPRDPIEKGGDQKIAEKAVVDELSKWNLQKLAKQMGSDYDFSELPTVVYHGSKPVVYDGNRRMVLAKLKLGFLEVAGSDRLKIPEIPKRIPCNVCSEETALRHVLRKHSETGSWLPLERDIFLHKFMKQPKSSFLILEDSTKLITSRPYLNQGFVRDEIFADESLKSMGFVAKDGDLLSVHNKTEAKKILGDIADKIEARKITTRTNRRKAITVLEPAVQQLIETNKKKKLRPTALHLTGTPPAKGPLRRTRRVGKGEPEIFGGPLYLKAGDVSNLYRAIEDLYRFYVENKATLGPVFPALIRMSLRLLAEAAAQGKGKSMGDYVKSNFDGAKATLSQDDKTTLSNQNVKKDTLEQLLHTGAHNYRVAADLAQTLAVSIIIGAILMKTYPR